MSQDRWQHICEPIKNLQSFNHRVWIQYEEGWRDEKGGWTLNLDPGEDMNACAEWVKFCPFCGVELPDQE